ncbi:MAG TPA: copper amine oxidase N-terminal domain-containing protein [Spirochaetia bacterium]|nr:copper amine oxidase N-terminal domain-containing protein [Spirochaetia bacterium]
MRSIVVALITLAVLLTGPVIPALAGTSPNTTVVFTVGNRSYTVNDQARTMDIAPFIDVADGHTYVPVRFLAEALGVAPQDIRWDAATGTVTLSLEEKSGWGRNIVLGLVIGSKTMTVTNRPGNQGIQAQFIAIQKVDMDAAPEIIGGRTMVPARWVVQSFGYALQWNQAGQQMVITG